MSKTLFLNQNVFKIVVACTFLCSCSVESDFIFALEIKNELTTPITYCDSYELPECTHEIKSGGMATKIYRARAQEDMADAKAFDPIRIKCCGKTMDFNQVRNISPVIQRAAHKFEIAINSDVYKAFCST